MRHERPGKHSQSQIQPGSFPKLSPVATTPGARHGRQFTSADSSMMTTMSARIRVIALSVPLMCCLAGSPVEAQPKETPLPGLQDHTTVTYDEYNVPTVFAGNEHDAIFMQGWLHARDRFFQMDHYRRIWSGTLAELLGPDQLAQDIQLRTLGLQRAAQWSLPLQTPAARAWLQAYAKGVNTFLRDESQPLPPEYQALELTRASIPLWTEIDSLTVLKGYFFVTSFNMNEIELTLQALMYSQAGAAQDFDGLDLLFLDVNRSAPFEPLVTIPFRSPPVVDDPGVAFPEVLPDYLNGDMASLLQRYLDKVAGIPVLQRALDSPGQHDGGNLWLASGAVTDTGYAIIANDPHLALDTPASFYEIHLNAGNTLNVTGVSFPGAPGIVLGCNDHICWGATANQMDVTDVYQEVLLSDPISGLPVATLFDGAPELLVPETQSYLMNTLDGTPDNLADAGIGPLDGGVTFLVPRRNFAPLVGVDTPGQSSALSVQSAGFSGTRGLEAFRLWSRARNVNEFKAGLQFFDIGSQNFGYADINGNIAYFTSGELPIREDLQTLGGPDGHIPPYLIRDGTHTLQHEWLPVTNPQPQQSLGWEILPFDEMPQVVNPGSGYVLNASNDPIGTTLDNNPFNQLRPGGGILYLSPGYATGYRIGRIQRLFDEALADGGTLSAGEIAQFQANNQLLDAEVLTPYLLTAFDNASADGAPAPLEPFGEDPGVTEAVSRLAAWDFSTPTGIPQGYDPGDDPDNLPAPSQPEIDSSVAATIYAAWRAQAVDEIVDFPLFQVGLFPYIPGDPQAMAATRNLLDTFPANQGVGASGVDFFAIPGVTDPAVARDLKLLTALRSALDLLASDDFAPAFGNSTNQEDYRWGNLHRITFDHPLGGDFGIPPGEDLADIGPGLPGVARAGGMGTLDASSHSARASGLNQFMFDSGPARRKLAVLMPDGPQVVDVIPGGQSGVFDDPPDSPPRSAPPAVSTAREEPPSSRGSLAESPFRADQLRLWLVNDYHPLPVTTDEVDALGVREEVFKFSAVPNMVTASDGVFVNRVAVTWNPVRGALTYRVYRCLDRGNSCGTPIGIRSGTSLNDGKGNPGQVYYYRVKACTASTCSKFSVADSGLRGSVKPTGVVASDGTHTDRVLITWNAVTGTTLYQVYRCLDRGNTCGVPIANTTGTRFNDRNGNPGQVYFYRVRACAAGACGMLSVADSGHTAPISDKPTGVIASDGTFADRVLITWNSFAGASLYRVYRCLDRGNTCGTPIANTRSTRFNDRTGNPGQVFFYRVRACAAGACSKFSIADAGNRP